MRVKIKVRDIGNKQIPKIQLVVQPQQKNLKGKYLDHIANVQIKSRKTVQRHIALNRHRANYWLSVGAIPTKMAHRVLARYGMLPPLPARYGSTHQYEKPERQYKESKFWGFGRLKFGANKVVFHYKQQLQEQMNMIERKRRLAKEAINTVGGAQAETANDIDAEDTDDIDSDDADIFERTQKFQKVLSKLEKHKQDKYLKTKGNDLRYNVYLKKLQKLARKDLGLDVAAYKDYVNNLKEFAHINSDLNVFAAENLAVNSRVDERGILMVEDKIDDGSEVQTDLAGLERVQANAHRINLTLAKFLRANSAFVSKKDRKAVKELIDHMQMYVLNDGVLANQLRTLYMRRKREQNQLFKKDLMFEEFLNLDAPTELLKKAKVSKKEFQELQMLCKFDRDIFLVESEIHQPNDLLVDNPYSFFVDFERLPANIPKKIKLILYRPERMARLKKAYLRVAVELNTDYERRQQEIKAWKRNQRIRIDIHQRQLPKKDEEYELMDELVKKIDTDFMIVGEDGLRQIDSQLLEADANIAQYTDIHDWYKPMVQKLIEERRMMPKKQRLEKFRNDSVDEVDTTDLEHWSFRGFRSLDSNLPGGSKDKIEQLNNKIDEESRFQDMVAQKLWEEIQEDDYNPKYEGMSPDEKRLAMKQEAYELIREIQELHQVGDLPPKVEEEPEERDDRNADPWETVEEEEKRTPNWFELNQGAPDFPGVPKVDPEIIFDGDLKQERKRFNQRHRVNLAKWHFGKDGGYSIRELKQMYKTEMEENPERYCYALDDINQIEKKMAKEAEQKVYNEAKAEGPIFDIKQDRTGELKILRDELDELIPQLKAKMSKSKTKGGIKEDKEYQTIVRKILAVEKSIKDDIIDASHGTIDEHKRGLAAQYSVPFFDSDVPLLPSHMRYIARQLSQIKRLRKIDFPNGEEMSEERDSVNFDEGNTIDAEEYDQDIEASGNNVVDLDDFEIGEPSQLDEKTLDEALGEALADGIEKQSKKLDASYITFIDRDLVAKVEGMSDEYIQSQIDKMLKDADELEQKLESMTLKERAKLDQYHHFSLQDFDMQTKDKLEEYHFIKSYQKSLADAEINVEDLDEDLQDAFKVPEELQQWHDNYIEQQNKQVQDVAALMVKSGEIKMAQDELEEILNAVASKEGLEDEEQAAKYYEEMTKKITKWYGEKASSTRKDPYIDLKKEPEDEIDAHFRKQNDPYSSAFEGEDFFLRKNQNRAYHEAQNAKIGRYPEVYRKYENFANYSQVKKDATIQEYMDVMNKPCEFHEYLNIRTHFLLELSRTPEFKHDWRNEVMTEYENKNNIAQGEDDQPLQVADDEVYMYTEDGKDLPEVVADYLKSNDFDELIRRDYAEQIQRSLIEKKHFSFVEAMEEQMDFWNVGLNLFDIPTHNVYIPVRNTIMKKPNLKDEDEIDNELGYMYNNYDAKDKTRQRFGPMDQLSPLRSNRMGPGRPRTTESYKARNSTEIHEIKPRYFRFRRLSKVHDRNFSTTVEQPSMVRSGTEGISMPSRFFSFPSIFRQQ